MDTNFQTPNYVGGAVDAFNMGRQMGQQMAIKNALDMYSSDPSSSQASQSALVQAGAIDQAQQLQTLQTGQIQQKARMAAAQAAQGGDYTGAAQAAAGAGDPALAGQYAQIPGQINDAHAAKISAGIGLATAMQQAIPQDANTPPEVTLSRRAQYVQQNAGVLKQAGWQDQEIQDLLAHPDADLSDSGIEALKSSAVAQGLYKPPLMTVPYGASVINSSTGQTVLQGTKLHPTTIKIGDGTTVPAFMDPVTRKVYRAQLDGSIDTSQAMPEGSYVLADGSPGAGGIPPSNATAAPATGSLAARNNNPGNLRADGSTWQGMTGVDPNGFVQFDTPENGERAARVNLANQQTLHGIDTIQALVAKYAPAGDGNNTAAYIQSVAQQTGFKPGQILDLHDKATQDKVLSAMFTVEGGGTPAKASTAPNMGGIPQGQTQAHSGQTEGGAFAPQMSDGDKALVSSMADQIYLGYRPQSRNPREQYLARQAQELALQRYGSDALNPANMASYQANSKELDNLAQQRDMVYSSEETVNKNLDILRELAPKGLAQGGAPVLNQWIQAGRQATGSPDVSSFNAAVSTVVSEYAKVMSGSTGGQGASDSARHEAQNLLNSSMTPDQLTANIAVLQREMNNRVGSIDETLNDRVRAIRTGTGPGATPPSASSPGATTPAGDISSTPGIAHIPGSTQAQHDMYVSAFKPGAPYGSPQNPLIVTDAAGYGRLQSGAHFVDPQGNIRVKP